MYEYGELYQYEHWGEYYWTFYYGGNEREEFSRSDNMLDCLNKLGKMGWKLTIKTNEDSYVLIRVNTK